MTYGIRPSGTYDRSALAAQAARGMVNRDATCLRRDVKVPRSFLGMAARSPSACCHSMAFGCFIASSGVPPPTTDLFLAGGSTARHLGVERQADPPNRTMRTAVSVRYHAAEGVVCGGQ